MALFLFSRAGLVSVYLMVFYICEYSHGTNSFIL
jgi:hypothetical protein